MKFVVPSLTKVLSSSLYPSFECLVGADLGQKGVLAVASFYELGTLRAVSSVAGSGASATDAV